MCAAMGAAEADEHWAVKYKDPKQPVAVRVEDLLSRMTLEEKIGQMVQIERSVATAEIMRNYSIGTPKNENPCELWTVCFPLFL